jgi:hypothetical protein
MPQFDEDDDNEISEYQRKLNTQIQEELDARGASGVPWEEVPDDLFDEAEKAAKKVVGDDPDAS